MLVPSQELICIFLLSMWAEGLISTPKLSTFWQNLPPGNEKHDLLSNQIPQPEYPYLSISSFLDKVTALNQDFFSVGSLLWELDASSS